MERTGYILDNTFDLIIENGRFKKGDTTAQTIDLVVMGAPGFIRHKPELGFNVMRFVKSNANRKQQFESELRAHLESIGIQVNNIDLSDKNWWLKFFIDAQ